MSREMKISGVEWIGEIPNHWLTPKLGNIIECLDGKRVPITSDLRQDGPYPYWGAGSITDYVNDYIFDEELILLGEDGAPFFDKKRNVAFYVKEKIWVNNHIHVLRAMKIVFPKFLTHFLNIVDYGSHINGSILNKLTQSNMRKINIALPDIKEQIAIANYIDSKLININSIIEQTKSNIEDYRLLKQSIITEAVTKGLDTNVVMKDSGIEWISFVPQNWIVTKIKHEAYLRARLGWKGLKADEYIDNGIMFLATPNIKEFEIDFINVNYISRERYEESPEIKLSVGDVLLTKDGSTLGTLNVVRHLPDEATINGSIALITPSKNLDSIYLYYYLKGSYTQNQIRLKKDGMGVPHLFQRDIREFIVLLPSIKEQIEIAKYLDNKCKELDDMILMKQSLLDNIEQYKKSLIYEYVTGKKEVL